MKRDKIIEGNVYEVKVGKNTTTMRVMKIERRVNGQVVFDCMNTKTDKRMTVSDEKRFVKEVKPSILQTAVDTITAVLPKTKGKKAETPTDDTATKIEPGKGGKPKGAMSGINAAYEVLKSEGRPMNIKEIMEKIAERGLAHLPGKTPASTVSAAIQRDMLKRGAESRFEKAGKGLFAAK